MGAFDPEPPRASLEEELDAIGIKFSDFNSDSMNWASDEEES